MTTTGAALAEARLNGMKLAAAAGPAPVDLDQAYAVQNEATATLGLPQVGWKIGATNALAQETLNTDRPFWGPLFERWVYASPTRVPMPAHAMNLVETEFAFRMADALPARDAPYSEDAVADAVEALYPAIEIVDTRLEGKFSVGVKWLIADGGANHAFIHGEGRADWRHMDLPAIAARVSMNGLEMGAGTGAAAMGSPLTALCHLVEQLRLRGVGLAAGDWISTGVVCPFFEADLGVPIVAEFDDLGRVEIVLT